jgi:5S rRNA maturation endonuclease (ribonuclease M5)
MSRKKLFFLIDIDFKYTDINQSLSNYLDNKSSTI